MAAVEFFEYYCICGQYLFRNCDILENTVSIHTSYIFVDLKDVPIYYKRNNVAKCNSCHSSIGGFCYLINKQCNTIRFCRHLIEKKKKRLYVYRVLDENGVIIPHEYEIKIV